MNIIIKNQNSKVLSELQVDVIKTLEGEFNRSEIEQEFVNLFYNRVIIDITAIRNYYDFTSLFDFLSFFEPSRVILLLNNSELVNSANYLSKLVEKGYYNFTKNASSIGYLIDHPNSLQDVQKYLVETNNNSNVSYANTDNDKQNMSVLPNEFGSKNRGLFNSLFGKKNEEEKDTDKVIIGIQNITEHAGATTLMYMMVKQLSYHYKVNGIEMNKQDGVYFRDDHLIMATSIEDLKMQINVLKDESVIIVDLNGNDAKGICTDILYLIEPGTIRLNKLFKSNRGVLEKTSNGKIILNRSAIKDDEISNLEYETKMKIFFNMPNFDERKERIQVIDELLGKLKLKKSTDK